MLVRCAYYVGTVAPENRKAFDDYVRNVHLPDVASWPRLRRLRLLKNGELTVQVFDSTTHSLGNPSRHAW